MSGQPLTITARQPRLWPIDGVLEPPSRQSLRNLLLRSRENVFADLGSDFGVLHRAEWRSRVWWYGGIVAVSAAAALLITGLGWRVGALAGAVLCALVGRRILAGLSAAALAFFFGLAWWLPPVAILGAILFKNSVKPALDIARSLGAWRPTRMLPRREVLTLVRLRSRFAVIAAIDFATAGFPRRAAETAATALTAIGSRAPSCRAMLLAVQALAAYEENDHDRALQSSELARQAAEEAAAGPRAWVLMTNARILGALGDTAAAQALAEQAVRIAPNDARELLLEARLQLRLLARDASSDPSEEVRAIHAARLVSLRRKSMLGLVLTELALLRAREEPVETQAEVAQWLLDIARAGYKGGVPFPKQVLGAAEEFAAQVAVARGEPVDAADHFAGALKAYNEANDPVQTALAASQFAELLSVPQRAPLLEGLSWEEQRKDCLDAALLAIERFNAVRYALPTSEWRQSWINRMSATYDLALRIATEFDSPARVAALIELSKSQAVPLTATPESASRTSALDAFLQSRASLTLDGSSAPLVNPAKPADAVRVIAGADPVAAPAQPVVAGEAMFESDQPRLDVEAAVARAAGRNAFYFTAAVTSRSYYWALLNPRGEWSAGSRNLLPSESDGQAVDALFKALPVRDAAESAAAYAVRVGRSPLLRRADRQAESDLTLAAGHALIPRELVDALLAYQRSHAELPRLLTSMPPALAWVPLAFLGVADADSAGDDRRLVEIADLQSLPSLQLAQHLPDTPPTASPDWPLDVAAAFATEGVEAVAAPPWAATIIDQRVPAEERKARLSAALSAKRRRRPATAYLSGHLAPIDEQATLDPLKTGLRLADLPTEDPEKRQRAFLTVEDLLRTEGDELFPLPERVLVLACSSLGIIANKAPNTHHEPTPGAVARWSLAGEWVGFGAACLLAGARLAVCTQFDQVDTREATEMDHQLARVLELAADPVHAISALQRRALADWREGRGPRLISAMCYAVVAC